MSNFSNELAGKLESALRLVAASRVRWPRNQLGGLVGAIHVEPFMESSIFRARVSEIMRRLSGLPPSQGTDRVRFPGEPEIETKRIRSRDGIPMGVNVLAELNELASHCGSQLLQPL